MIKLITVGKIKEKLKLLKDQQRALKILEEEKCMKQYDATDNSPDYIENYEDFQKFKSNGEI